MATATPTELNLKPLAAACCVSGRPFAPGDRVVSYLVRPAADPEGLDRFDLLEREAAPFVPEGTVACRWVQEYREKPKEDPARALKLTVENLFLTLADPANEPSPENARLVSFLALLLERRKVLRPKGPTPGGESELFEHARTRQVYPVSREELTPEFFASIQGPLRALGL